MAEQNVSRLDYTALEINNGIAGGLAYSQDKDSYAQKEQIEELYLKKNEAENVYAKQSELDETYLKQSDAENIYAKNSDLSNYALIENIQILKTLNSGNTWNLTASGKSRLKVLSINNILYYVTGIFTYLGGYSEIITPGDGEITTSGDSEIQSENINESNTKGWVQIGTLLETSDHNPVDDCVLQVAVLAGTTYQLSANVKIRIENKVIYLYSNTSLVGATLQITGIYS